MTPRPDPLALELLVAVAEHGSVGAAARTLGVAQPNASRSLARLERTLDLRLLHRTTAGSSLTGEGLLVVDWAREVLRAYDVLRDGTSALSARTGSTMQVSASQTIAEHLLPAWLAALRAERPGTTVGIQVRNSTDVAADLRDGRADLGFVEGPQAPPGLHHAVVARDELVAVVAPGHVWARRRRPLAAEDLLATPLVTREAGSGTRVVLDDALGSPAPVAIEVASNAAVRVAVAAGAGPAVLSRLAVAEALATGTLVEVPVQGLRLRRQLRAAWAGPRRLTGAAAALVGIARRGTP